MRVGPRIAAVLIGLVIAGTALVAVGVGQGSPPTQLTLSAAAQRREVAALRRATGEVARGRELFDDHGCNRCHTIAAGGFDGRLGPRLDVQEPGTGVAALESSITDPPTSIPGYEAGLMPEDFATRLPRADIHALAAFIHAAATAATPR